jgi:hypothetical protein
MGKNANKVNLRDDTARIVADICDVSVSTVQKVRNGIRENETVLEILVDYQQGKSALIQELKQRIQITPNPEKYAR